MSSTLEDFVISAARAHAQGQIRMSVPTLESGKPFLDEVVSQFGQPLIAQVFTRYRINLTWSLQQKTIDPERVMMLLEVTLNQPQSSNVAFNVLQLKMAQIFQYYVCGSKQLEMPAATFEKFRHTAFKKELFRHSLQFRPLTLPAFYELLAKKLAMMPLKIGTKLNHLAHDRILNTYIVTQKLEVLGLTAFVLQPELGQPVLLFRPTVRRWNDNGLLTIADDLNTRIGIDGYTAAERALTQLLLPEKMHTLIGFSLAGAYAARFLAKYPERFNKAYFFNDPSTEAAVNQQFLANLKKTPASYQITINIYHSGDDITPYFGQVHVGYYETTPPEKLTVNYYRSNDENVYAYSSFFQRITGVFSSMMRLYHHHTALFFADLPGHKSVKHSTEVGADTRFLNHATRPLKTQWAENYRQRFQFIRSLLYYLILFVHHVIKLYQNWRRVKPIAAV